jgi:cytochrome P450
VVYELIERCAHRPRDERATDVISLLRAARERDGVPSAKLIHDEVTTFLIAGQECPSIALAWALHLLANHPRVEAKVVDEIRRVLVDRPLDHDRIARLEYIRMVIEEAMRLYPPAWILSRQANEEDEIGGFRIPKNSIALVVPYVTHRDAAFWDLPDEFIPERFDAAQLERPSRYVYFPFGVGPRECIGKNLAILQAQITIGLLLKNYRLHPVAPERVVPEPSFTLRPRNLMVTLERRR